MSSKQNDLLTSETTRKKGRCYSSNSLTMILTVGATILVTIYLLQQPMLVEGSSSSSSTTTSPETTITNRSNNLTEQQIITIITTTSTNTNIDNINNSSRNSSSSTNTNSSSNNSNDSNNNITNEKQIPLVRLPSNTLLKYTAYKDVSILHFRIPVDTQTALFSFKAYEESKSAFSKYNI